MEKDFSIKISDFIGIYKTIAEKANIHGGETLEKDEIYLFHEAKQTLFNNNSVFCFDGQYYDKNGDLYQNHPPRIGAKQDKPIFEWGKKESVDDFRAYNENQKQIVKNEQALNNVNNYVKKYGVSLKEEIAQAKQHRETVKRIAASWANTYPGIDNKNGEFTQFIEELYNVAKELKIERTNDGITKETFKPSEKYPTIEDQIVDEMCGAFANESEFSTSAVSANKLYYGIFQFSQKGLNDLIQNGYIEKYHLKPIPGNKIQNFVQLSRLEQLQYMKAYVIDCKRLAGVKKEKELSPKSMYAMWISYMAGKDNPDDKQQSIINNRNSVIIAKLRERDRNQPITT